VAEHGREKAAQMRGTSDVKELFAASYRRLAVWLAGLRCSIAGHTEAGPVPVLVGWPVVSSSNAVANWNTDVASTTALTPHRSDGDGWRGIRRVEWPVSGVCHAVPADRTRATDIGSMPGGRLPALAYGSSKSCR
jgi:hypothetical protein